MSSKYTSNKFKMDIVSGGSRGAIFGFCWGLIQGSYSQFDEKLPFPKYARKVARYTGKSVILFAPLVIISQTSYNFIKSYDYGEFPSMVSAICITSICFGIVKNFI